ncbi:GNAT family N-acetyltransferase [Lederbergia citrea]|uniref:GNAT family N-acetyltransferase n=1 Tax=Lederbergia citrea TaxID=2833581 RepID=A0A942UXT7_9BACI|nr:GNAT family N-acetyltransferase [Lederbergia citrea]MBS4224754.1 GNAT family N-acetyltransferase [Lederbergia citrea]
MEVIIHQQIDSLEKILPKWAKLKEGFREITTFQDINWIKGWWDYKSKQRNITPYIIEIRKRNNNETIGIIPLYYSHVKVAGLSFCILKPMGSELSDYLIPILSKEYSAEKILSEALDKIYEGKSNWDCIIWGDIPENSFFDSFLNTHLSEEYAMIERKRADVCPFLILNKDVEEVILKFDKKLVKEVLSKERKLKRDGSLNYCKVVTADEIEPIMNKLFELHCERWEKTNTPSRFRLKEEREHALLAAKNLFNSNLLHLSYLIHNDEIVAVECAKTDGKKIYLYLTAFNIKFKRYSVGNLLLYNLILEACKEGYEIVDFTRGNESYKQQWGTIDKYNVNYVFFNLTLKSVLFKSIHRIYHSKHFNLYMQKFVANRLLAKSAVTKQGD